MREWRGGGGDGEEGVGAEDEGFEGGEVRE